MMMMMMMMMMIVGALKVTTFTPIIYMRSLIFSLTSFGWVLGI